jgi:NADP-dependent 3-hydroxy acid dehydrogenase YdfG
MDKVAIVTGASYGVGKETAKLLSANGYHVIAIARSIDLLKKLEKENKNIEAYALDVTDDNAVKKFGEYLNNKNVEVLINNAGGGIFYPDGYLNDSAEYWRKAYDLNVVGPMELSRVVLPHMIKNNKGHIVLITSTAGHFVYKNGGGYVVAKRAEVALSELLRLEMFNERIKITEIAPGNINSRGDRDPNVCLNPEDIAEAIRWVVSLPYHVNIDNMSILNVNTLRR